MKIIICLVLSFKLMATPNPTAMLNGPKDERHPVTAFINANIFTDAETELTNATLIIQDGKVLAVGQNVQIPQQAHIRDLHGAYIYPGFILLDSNYGLPKPAKKAPFSFFGAEIMDSTTTGAVNTNEAIKASYQGINDFHHDEKQAKELRQLGFSTVLTSNHDGIMRGSSVLVNLNENSDNQSILKANVAMHLSFDKGSSKQLYPISLMGSSALIRQTWLDASWYGDGHADYTDVDLAAINKNNSLPRVFETKNWQQTLLADKLGKEFDQQLIIKTSGDEYKHIDAIKKLNRQLIVPLVMPKAPKISDELDAWNVSLTDMMKWQMAPYNSYYLHENGIEFALVPANNKSFLKDLTKAVKKGLPQNKALAALTTTPARFLKNPKLGNLKKGSYANFIIAEKNIFEKGGKINENWVAGERYEINRMNPLQSGIYALTIDGKTDEIELQNKAGKLAIKTTKKDSKIKYKAKISEDFINLTITDDKKNSQTLLGLVEHNAFAQIAGSAKQWQAKRIKDSEKKDKKADEKTPIPVVPQPFSAYGLAQQDTAKSFLITHATVWTGEAEGVLEDTDVYVKNGKINKIGKNLTIKADKIIDGKGQYLTAGIIDEHSHIALLSVNDIMANSSMVRMEDSLNSDDVSIYRNLSGGVTAAQLLHGSANPIGGQSAMIKMRWGATGDELLVKGADKFIKFALGENVKRSRSQNSIRYPLTRMGVEQVYRDAFTNALLYEKQWQDYNKLSRSAKKKTAAPRRDLMMEATLEVINKERFITCHSYVQSEINMLMHVADDFDFKVNTFTHILEGYKVADKMLAHGVGASTFADWWAYKWEVNYAIPYNASILTKVGVTTAINSDDPEMSRRLNQEAAKSIKYGGLSEQQAWKMVTLNPAKLLHLDDRMGSIKVGKDADIVLWNANPLSIYATAQKTFVDGKLLFDRESQTQVEAQIVNKRAELIKQINQSDEPKMPVSMKPEKHMQCDSLTGYEYLGAAQ